jgi:hypothetical protein
MNVIKFIILLFFVFGYIQASENTIKDIQRVSYGLSLLPSLSLHRAEMLPPKPMSICCPEFTKGEGLGYDISFFSKYVIDYNHSIGATFGYRDIGAILLANTYSIVNSKNQLGLVRSRLEAELSLINFQFLYCFTPFRRFDITLGMMLGINASKNYTYRENIIDSLLLFDNGTQQRNTSIGALVGINPRYFGIVLGTSYKIPIIKDELFLKPLIQYTHALRPTQFGTNWYADALTFGLGVELHPFGEIQKPITVKNDTEELTTIVQSPIYYSINIDQVQTGKMHIDQKVYFMPVLHDLYTDILNPNEFNSSSYINCIYDHGSCNYPWIIDTILQRMHKYPEKKLNIELNGGINSELLIKKLKEYSTTRNIDTSRFIFTYVQEQETQKIGKITNEDLIAPYEMLSTDTSYEYHRIQFDVRSNSEYAFDWGLYDFETKQIIKKGKSKCNKTIFIDSIPNKFRQGTLRALIFEEENKKLIQSDIQMDKNELIVSEPYQYETAAIFEFNSDKLRNIDIESLIHFMKGLKKEDTIIIEAFTDLSGDIALNMDLAKRRAESVSFIFKESPKEIILSPLKPRNSGKKEYQKAYNRIVTIKRK